MLNKPATRNVTVNIPQGLHARPAHAFVTTAKQFESDVRVVLNDESVDGKSILSILTLGAQHGVELTLTATGEDASQALDALEELFLNDFGGDGEEEEAAASKD